MKKLLIIPFLLFTASAAAQTLDCEQERRTAAAVKYLVDEFGITDPWILDERTGITGAGKYRYTAKAFKGTYQEFGEMSFRTCLVRSKKADELQDILNTDIPLK